MLTPEEYAKRYYKLHPRPTCKQLELIEKITYTLGVKFEGKTLLEAQRFIAEHIEKYLKKRQQSYLSQQSLESYTRPYYSENTSSSERASSRRHRYKRGWGDMGPEETEWQFDFYAMMRFGDQD
jgi:hypothetical protein